MTGEKVLYTYDILTRMELKKCGEYWEGVSFPIEVVKKNTPPTILNDAKGRESIIFLNINAKGFPND